MRVLVSTAMIFLSTSCWAHPGGLDSSGGHNDRRNGGYHYHGGAASPQPVFFTPAIRDIPQVREPRTTARSKSRYTSREKDAREEIAEDFKPSKSPPAALAVIDKPVVDRERQAQGKLGLAKNWISKGRPESAARLLQVILQEFPETNAASDAETLYQKSTGRKFERDTSSYSVVAREQQAKELLEKARGFIGKKMPAEATRWLTEVLLLFPETMASKDARVEYEKLSGHKFDPGERGK